LVYISDMSIIFFTNKLNIMKFKTLLLFFLLIITAIQLNAQIDPIEIEHDVERPCASLVNVQQECNKDGTVTITYQIANNTLCNVSSVTILYQGGLGQSIPINIGPQTVSTPLTQTFLGSVLGTSVCFDLILVNEEGRKCCSTRACFKVNKVCCDLKSKIYSVSCGPYGTAHIGIGGGTPPYSGPGFQQGVGNFYVYGLSSGTHTLTFTDSEGCKIDVTVTVQSERCCGFDAELLYVKGCAPKGEASIHVTGGTPPYSGPGTQNALGYFYVTGLTAGDHILTYTDANRCEISITVTIEKCCELKADLISSGGCSPNGWARIFISGGTGPYSGPGQEVGTIGNFVVQGLTAGTHVLVYTDANGCEIEVTVIIEDCCDLEAELIDTGGCPPNAWARIFVSGGTPPYFGPGTEFGAVGNFIISNLSSGTETVEYTDANGCIVNVTYTIPVNNLNSTVTNSGGCGSNGFAQISVSGGTPPYSSGTQVNSSGNFVFFNLSSGTHTFTFTDANGCSVTETVTIADTTLDASIVSQINATCTSNGRVTIELQGGNPPYSGPPNATNVFFNYWEITDLPPGDYIFPFTDSNGCEVEVPVTILDDTVYSNCADFLAFTADQNNDDDKFFTSGVSASITVHLEAYCIPDRVFIYKNGALIITLTAGSDPCDGNNSCNGDSSQACAEFCVEPCDRIRFEFEGDWCADSCPSNVTAWNFSVTDCSNCNGGGSSIISETNSDLISFRERNNIDPEAENSLINELSESVEVFPNPVTDILTVSYSSQTMEYQTARIFNSAGSLLYTVNMEGQNQVQIDASTFPQGNGLSNLIC